jgi:hypothetical protein
VSQEAEALQQLQEARAQLFEWNQLSKCVGWARLKQVLTAQKNLRIGKILREPTTQLVDVLVREYERGEAAVLDLTIELPETEIQRLQELVKLLSRRITTEENGNETEISNDELAP